MKFIRLTKIDHCVLSIQITEVPLFLDLCTQLKNLRCLPSSPFIRLEGSTEICCLAALILCFSPLPFSLNLPMSGASWTGAAAISWNGIQQRDSQDKINPFTLFIDFCIYSRQDKVESKLNLAKMFVTVVSYSEKNYFVLANYVSKGGVGEPAKQAWRLRWTSQKLLPRTACRNWRKWFEDCHLRLLSLLVFPSFQVSFLFPSFSFSQSCRQQSWPCARIPCPCSFFPCTLPHKTGHKTSPTPKSPVAAHIFHTLHNTEHRHYPLHPWLR